MIGLLDWGVGGLGVVRELRRRRPDVPVFYWSDTGAMPYGTLGAPVLAARVRAVLAAMVEGGATHLVIACNAASTVADRVGDVGAPIVNVIEHAVAMIPRDLRGTLGVVGGARTIRSGRYGRALARPGLRVIQRIAQPISGHIEAGRGTSPALAADLARIMAPLARVDALLLACTHYPAIADAFQRHAPGARLYDPAAAVVSAALARWRLPTGGADRFATTGDPVAMQRAARLAWDLALPRVERRALRAA